MAKGLFTALFNALSDPKSYYAMQKEVNLQAVAQTFFNSLAGKTTFEAVILPEDIGSPVIFDGKRAVRVRPLDIYDLIIPEPCSFDDVATRKRVLSLHPIAYPDFSGPSALSGSESPDSEPDPEITDARIVECFFKSGPQTNGRLRGLTYRPKTIRSFSRMHGTNYACLYASGFKGPGEIFDEGGHTEHTKKDLFDNTLYQDVKLGEGFRSATSDITSFGAPIPCGEIIAFGGRKENKILEILKKNPPPSEKSDRMFWSAVLRNLGAKPTENKIRLFYAWAAKESPSNVGPTNNPFATMYPSSDTTTSVNFDPYITAFNWNTKNIKKYPKGFPWVKNYSTIEIGAKATAATINKKQFYAPILKKLREPNPDFPDSWFDSPQVVQSFCYWGGCSPGGDGHGYASGVKSNYKKKIKPKFNINTNKLSGRAAACLKKK